MVLQEHSIALIIIQYGVKGDGFFELKTILQNHNNSKMVMFYIILQSFKSRVDQTRPNQSKLIIISNIMSSR